MSHGREFTEDERIVLRLANEDAYGFVEVAGEVGDIARAQAAVRDLLADGLVVVERRDHWEDVDQSSDYVLAPADAVTAVAATENWMRQDDPSSPWHQIALPSYE